MKISISLFSIFVFSIFFVCLITKANIDNLKNSYSILKDDYKHLSIIHGAIADEKYYLMNLYDYGSFGEEIDIADQNGVMHKVPDVKNSPAVVKLVHFFFHRNPGAMNQTDFVLTRKFRDATLEEKEPIIQAIADMIGIAQTTKKITALDARFKQKLKLDKLQNSAQLFKAFILNSYIEERGNKAILPENTTNTVLLGIVYRLAGDNKSLIKMFYEKLNEAITNGNGKESIFVNGKIPDNWVTEKFDYTQKEIIAAQVKAIKPNEIEAVIKNFENIVYLTLLPGNYPPLPGYIKANYFYDKANPEKQVSFTDCMDNTLRNI